MNLTRVELFAGDEEIITFSLRDLDPRAKYQVKSIFGLDADEIIHKFYGFSSSGAQKGYDFSLNKREIPIRAQLNPNFRNSESSSEVRDRLYRTIQADRTGVVTLYFYAGATAVFKISGFVTKFEVPLFTQISEVQITVLCDDPMFRGVNVVRYDDEDVLNPLSIADQIIIPDSHSTAPHGFVMDMTFASASDDLYIHDEDSEWEFRVTPSGGFEIDDILHFSSEYSDKFLWIERGVDRIDLFDAIDPTAVWPIVFPGGSTFIIENHEGDKTINFIEYYPAYWGV